MAYTTHQKVAAFLGLTLTAGQQTLITNDLEPAMAAYIDRFTGRSWGGSSPVTDEMHPIVGDRVYLKNRPVSAVSAVKTRGNYEGASVTTLDSGAYELLDATNGVLLIQGWSAWGGGLALVTYTHTATTAPADIQHAATMLVAAHLHDALLSDPTLRGVKQYAVGQGDISITFDTAQSAGYASSALEMLKLRRSFVFA